MRVTQSMVTSTTTMYLMRDLERLQAVQQKIATGKNYTLPSDNPIATTQILHYSSRIAETEQYRRAIDTGVAWNEMTSSVLTQVEDLLSEILDVSQAVSSDGATSAERSQAASSMNQLLEELVMLANRKFKDKYIFGGDEVLTAPFTAEYDADGTLVTGVTANPNGIDGLWGYLVSDVDTVTINTPGSEVFQPSGEGASDDVFAILVDLRDAHQNNDIAAIGTQEEALHEAILRIADVNAAVGNRINHLESIGEDLDAVVLSYETQRSELEDADLAESIIEYNTAENIYQAALSSTARILHLSLANFI
jgi:flagellar hook-associated protein 3 FlgL